MSDIEESFSLSTDTLIKMVDKYEAPLFLYDGDKIKSQFLKLTDAVKIKNLKINYACKALTNPSILKLIKSLGGGLDAVSIGEVLLGLESGFSKEEIMYTPNCVSLEEIEEVRNLGVKVNIDNLELLSLLGEKYPGIELGIRINPHLVAGGNSKIQVGHIDSKFGISIHLIEEAKEVISKHNIRLQGIHMHTGSDILNMEVFLKIRGHII